MTEFSFTVLGGVAQMTNTSIDEMEKRKDDLEFQLQLCRQIMTVGAVLPFPFDRATVLLRKAKRFDEELEICRYVKSYSEKAEKSWDGRSAMVWKSPKLQKCVARVDKLEKMLRD